MNRLKSPRQRRRGSPAAAATWRIGRSSVRAAQKQADNAIQAIEAAMMGMAQDIMRDFGLRGYRATWRRTASSVRRVNAAGTGSFRRRSKASDTPGLSSSQGGRLFFPIRSATISFFRPRFSENMR